MGGTRGGGDELTDERMAFSRPRDAAFVLSAVLFNVLVSAVYVSTKLDLTALRQVSGLIIVSLIVPFALTLRGYVREEAERKVIVSNIIVLLYLVLELLLDYVLRIPFREMLAIHVIYIVVFYAAEFSLMSVSFRISRKAGYAVVATFCVLLGCLAYLYLG
jgi:hypothetical protein